MSKAPNIVSKRNEFYPADELVENALPHLPDQFKHPNFRAWLLRYTEMTIKSIASHFGVAANRGIEQAANLLCDPEFYETRKRKRRRWDEKTKQTIAEQEYERWERKNCPTQKQIEEQVRWHEQQHTYHMARLAEHAAELAKLQSLVPINTTTATKSVQ